MCASTCSVRVAGLHRRGVVAAVEGNGHGLHVHDAQREVADGRLRHRHERVALGRRGALVDVHQRLDQRRRFAAHLPHAEIVRAGKRGDDRQAVDGHAATLPRSTRQASTACLPMVSASLFMMQPPAKTSAVRAST